MTARSSSPDWKAWLRRWDKQQASLLPSRERRFHIMLDVLEATVGRSPRVLDLGSGPGSLSFRVLQRFPHARCVAVDYDPVVLRIGQGALGSYRGRLTWVDAKLGAPGWTRRLPPGKFDAAISTTALHWLPPASLRRVYRDLGGLLRVGGVFLNGDHLAWGSEDPRLTRLSRRVYRVHRHGRKPEVGWGAWDRWWRDAGRVPALAPSFAEHRRRQAQHPRHDTPPLPLNAHVRALRKAGFRTVTVVWQIIDNRVLFAQR
ncbi:MAG: class I SAM-dependent methyltransferase [Thermoplasmata archaeon]